MKAARLTFTLFANTFVLVMCLAVLTFSISPLVSALKELSTNVTPEQSFHFDYQLAQDCESLLDNLLEEEAVLYFCYNRVNNLSYDVKSIHKVRLVSFIISRSQDISIRPPKNV